MIIRFDIEAKEIEVVSRYELRVKKENKIVDVGAKTLPINLGDVFNKANSFCHSKFCDTFCIDNQDYNIINSYNISNGNLYNKCHKNNYGVEELKEKAKGELVDIHFFPIMYKNSNENKERAYVDYNLRNALIAMLEMEQSLQWLVGYNENVQFVVEDRDVEKTLWSVANRLSHNSSIKKEAIETVMAVYHNIDGKYVASKFQDYMWNVDHFIGKERFLKDITNYETYDKSKFVGVYAYGEKRMDSWTSVHHRCDDDLCLFVDNDTKMMLKRIKNSMTGQKFHSFLKELIGEWFDLDDKKIWAAIRQNMKRIDDSKLDPMFDVGVCTMGVKDYFEKLGSLCYNGTMVDEDVSRETLEETTVIEENSQILEENTAKTDLFDTIVEETIAQETQYKDLDILKDLEGLEEGSQEWWDALSK